MRTEGDRKTVKNSDERWRARDRLENNARGDLCHYVAGGENWKIHIHAFSCARKKKKEKEKEGASEDTLTSKQVRCIVRGNFEKEWDAIMKVEEGFQANQLLYCTNGEVRMKERNGGDCNFAVSRLFLHGGVSAITPRCKSVAAEMEPTGQNLFHFAR